MVLKSWEKFLAHSGPVWVCGVPLQGALSFNPPRGVESLDSRRRVLGGGMVRGIQNFPPGNSRRSEVGVYWV